jgi:hypothetical protein
MRHFQTLPTDLLQHLLKDEEDILNPEMDRRIAEIKGRPCPRCGAAMHPKIHDPPFSESDPLPRLIATCECGFAQDPKTGLVLELGSAAKIQDPLPIIKVNDD